MGCAVGTSFAEESCAQPTEAVLKAVAPTLAVRRVVVPTEVAPSVAVLQVVVPMNGCFNDCYVASLYAMNRMKWDKMADIPKKIIYNMDELASNITKRPRNKVAMDRLASLLGKEDGEDQVPEDGVPMSTSNE